MKKPLPLLLAFSWIVAATVTLPCRADGLVYEATGGPILQVRAKAEQQHWTVLGNRILVAAVADGKLRVEEFYWPPGPAPGPEPKPDPKPEPEPIPTSWQVAVFLETDSLDNLPEAQRALLASLLIRNEIQKRGHYFLGIFDPNTIKTSPALEPWQKAAHGKTLPLLLLAPKEGGTIRAVVLPENTDAFWKLLENPSVSIPPPPKQEPRSPGRGSCLGPACQ